MKNIKIIAGITACALMGCPAIISGIAPGQSITADAADYTDTAYGDYNCRKYSDHIEITGIKDSAAEAIIPEKIYGLPVTSISEGAFLGHKNLTKAVIPDTVTYIGDSAFSGCSSLISIKLPENITSIPDGIFCNCTSLQTIDIPESVTSIGNNAFSGSGIASINLPDDLESIGESAFYNCKNLTEIIIPENVTEIKKYTFRSCTNLSYVKLPDSVKHIQACAFQECSSLTHLDFPKQLEGISNYAFAGSGLKQIDLPVSLKWIGICAFQDCPNLVNPIIPKNVTDVNDYAFSQCPNVKLLTILNPECNLHSLMEWTSITALSGYDGSMAHIYANEYNLEFISLGEAPSPVAQGDANGDGLITGSDATLALREYTLISSGMDGALAADKREAIDVNHDGIITGSDATMILRYYTLLSSGMSPDWDNL